MEIAVTGGAGFIGRYVVDELKIWGHTPHVIDRHENWDVRSEYAARLISDCDGVIHLAGILGTEELFDEPEEAVDVNIKGTIAVLKACAPSHTRYVGISMPQVWDNVYQATKLAAGKLASAWHRHFDVPVCHVRAFNVFGPGQKFGRPQKIVPTFSTLAWRGEPLPVWGTGEQKVDLIHVGDVAKVLVDALGFGNDQLIDAGTGVGLTVNQVALEINTITGNPAGIEHRPMRKGEHGKGIVAPGMGWELLGYRPHFSIDDLAATVESYRYA